MRNVSARLYLLGLITVAVVPVWLFAAFLVGRYAFSERQRFEVDATQVAAQVGLVVEAELRSSLRILDGLSKSNALASGDIDALDTEARRIVQGTNRVIILREPGDRQLINTSVPRGEALPASTPLSDRRLEMIEPGQPLVGDVYLSSAAGDVRAWLALPVSGPDSQIWLLILTLPTSAIRDAMMPAVPEGWIAGVGDRDGTYVARSQLHEELTGQPGLPEYVEKVVGRSGTFTAGNLQGVTLLAGYYRSPFSHWFYTANVPLETVQAPFYRSLAAVGGMGLLTMLLSSALAFYVGDRFASAAGELVERARALGNRDPVKPITTSISEFAVIGDALVSAERAITGRARELEAVVDTVPAAVWFTYDPAARQVIRNRFAADLMEIAPTGARFGSAGEVIDTKAYKDGLAIKREDRPLSRAMHGELTDNEEFLYVLPSGVERVLLTSARPITGLSGEIVGAVQVSLDISERKRGEEQRKLLVNELNHRVKNTLAVVQSIANQTLRSAKSLPEANKSLTSRLASLARAHDILTATNWAGADLRTLIESNVSNQADCSRFTVEGEAVELRPSLSLSITLALHELTTNAIKYGALSNETGHVHVAWTLTEGENCPRLTLSWRETGGPTVGPVTRQGFGSRLLQRLLEAEPGGSVSTTFAASGVVCVLQTDLLPTDLVDTDGA